MDPIGLGGAIVSGLLIGTLGIIFRMVPQGYPMETQMAMCIGIFVGMFTISIIGYRDYILELKPLASVGGILWCLGNATLVPIIDCIGFALGLGIWGTLALATGWSCGYFGLLGMKKDDPRDPVLNAIGAFLCVIGAIILSRVRTSQPTSSADKLKGDHLSPSSESDDIGLLPISEVGSNNNNNSNSNSNTHDNASSNMVGFDESSNSSNDELLEHGGGAQVQKEAAGGASFFARLPQAKKQQLGTLMSIAAGILYGLNMIPLLVLVQREGENGDPLHHVISYSCGIIGTSFILYAGSALYTKSWHIPRKVMSRAVLAGLVWSAGASASFISNARLSVVVGYPLTTMAPSVVSTLWAVFLFREIRGRRDFLILFLAYGVIFLGVALIVLGK